MADRRGFLYTASVFALGAACLLFSTTSLEAMRAMGQQNNIVEFERVYSMSSNMESQVRKIYEKNQVFNLSFGEKEIAYRFDLPEDDGIFLKDLVSLRRLSDLTYENSTLYVAEPVMIYSMMGLNFTKVSDSSVSISLVDEVTSIEVMSHTKNNISGCDTEGQGEGNVTFKVLFSGGSGSCNLDEKIDIYDSMSISDKQGNIEASLDGGSMHLSGVDGCGFTVKLRFNVSSDMVFFLKGHSRVWSQTASVERELAVASEPF